MISVIIVYNDVSIQESLTVRSLRNQTKKYELILIENIGNKNFNSAATALNAGAKESTGDYLMFVHQDVDLMDDRFLDKAEELLSSVENLGVAGVAGMSVNGLNNFDRQRNQIFQGIPKRLWGNAIESLERVQTLDECLLIIPRKVFEIIQFDEIASNNWHLYGVDYCLMVARQGLAVYVLPLPIYHQSAGDSAKVKPSFFRGSLSSDYFTSFETVRKKHRDHFECIYTTCAIYSTKYPVFIQRVMRMLLRLF